MRSRAEVMLDGRAQCTQACDGHRSVCSVEMQFSEHAAV